MKISRITSISVLVIFAFITIMGCETIPRERRGAAVGAGLGGVAGAVIGGDTPRGAIIGGLVGALIGGAIGHYGYDQRRGHDETTQAYADYDPAEGTRIYIEEAQTSPQNIASGETVELQATYAVLTPSPDTRVDVTETREILHNGTTVGNPKVNVERTGGTYTSTIPLTLPEGADTGTYSVRTTIEAAGTRDTRETAFTIY